MHSKFTVQSTTINNYEEIESLLGKADDTTYLQRCFVCTLYESEERSLSRNTVFCLFGCAFFHAGAARLAKNRHYNDLPDIRRRTIAPFDFTKCIALEPKQMLFQRCRFKFQRKSSMPQTDRKNLDPAAKEAFFAQ